MTTTATKRMRFAALGLTTALSIGGLAPFIGQSEASAATTSCSTATAQYSTASAKLAKDKAKLKKAKKKLKKAKKHHRSHAVVKHRKKKVKRLKKAVRADKGVRNYYYASTKNCTTGGTTKPGGGTTTPPTTTNPLSSILGSLLGSGLPTDQLTEALQGIVDQLKAAGATVPGGTALADALQSLVDGLKNGVLAPDALPNALSALTGSGLDASQFQNALSKVAADITSSLDPNNLPTSAQGVLDAILNPLVDGLNAVDASKPLGTTVGGVQDTLDDLIGALGLTDLAGLPGLPGLPTGGLPTDPTALANLLFDNLDASQLTGLGLPTDLPGLIATLISLLGGGLPLG